MLQILQVESLQDIHDEDGNAEIRERSLYFEFLHSFKTGWTF